MNLKDLGFDFDEIDIPVIFGDEDLDRKYQEYFFNFDDAILDIPLYFFTKDNEETINYKKKDVFIKLINKAIKNKEPITNNTLQKFYSIFDKENEYT
jgi:hypothetical protein|tara:strand:+ start:1428 stop:1718 length:291 start_codon:yes stop_codon:yes gene_type:complete